MGALARRLYFLIQNTVLTWRSPTHVAAITATELAFAALFGLSLAGEFLRKKAHGAAPSFSVARLRWP